MVAIRSFVGTAMIILPIGIAAAQSQPFDFLATPPFGLGRMAGQVQWGITNCGGKRSAMAETLYARATATNATEFKNGVQTGMRDMEGYRANLGNVPQACALVQSMYGPTGIIPGLWNR